MARFAFLIHPLAPWHRRLLGARRLHAPAMLGGRADSDLVGPIAEIRIESRLGPIEGRVIGVPDLAALLVEDQERALQLEERAMHTAIQHGCEVIGLGNALAVVASRGKELQRLSPVPVTTGHASTAWCFAEITRRVASERARGPIGVLGFAGTVGDAVAAKLRADGFEVRVDASGSAGIKRAAALGAIPGTVDDVLGACRLVVGASTTGPSVSPTKVRPNTVLVDLALPPTLMPGPLPAGFRAVKGEA